MEDKQRRILDRNYCLLVNNIVMTEEFYQCLRRENVIPETMIRDIESKSTREERNERLLETLQLRGGDAYRKFRHVLYLTGHSFLADHLYGEDVDIKILRGDELFSKFPSAFNTVSDDVKSKLLKYLETKVRERSLTTAWLKSGPERNELMDARKVAYDNEKEFRFKLDMKNKKIQNLRDEVAQLSEELKIRNTEVTSLRKDVEEMKLNFKEELATQTRFNAANNHSIIQLRQRFDNFNERVKVLNVTVKGFLTDEDDDEDEDNSGNFRISTLELNVRKLLQFARVNVENTSSSLMERDAVLRMLKASSRQKHQTLSEVVKLYIEKQEKGKSALFHELERLLEIIRGRKPVGKKHSPSEQVDLKLLKSQVATLRVEVEHVKKKLDWKDNQISDLIQENTTLRANQNRKPISNISLPRIKSARSRGGSPTKSVGSPDSNIEMERVYQQFDRYISESGCSSPPPKQSRMRRGSLADVNLERDFTPPPLPFSKNRRSSRVDNIELDILGTGRRASRDLSSSSFNNLSHSGLLGRRYDAGDGIPIHEKVYRNADHSSSQNVDKNFQRSVKQSGSQEIIAENQTDGGGRRPSLAELITIYETSRNESAEKVQKMSTNSSKLQTVSEGLQQ